MSAAPDWNLRLLLDGSPLHGCLRDAAQCLADLPAWPDPDTLTARLSPRIARRLGAPVRFVPDPGRPRRRAKDRARSLDAVYDARITVHGEIPTRAASWHDTLNALVWATFPRAKRALSARQYALHRSRVGDVFAQLPGARLPAQDALALLDEGGLLLATTAQHADALARSLDDADHAALARACASGEVSAWLFGHALHEHLLAGDDSARAAPVTLTVTAHTAEAIDHSLAALLDDPTHFHDRPTRAAVPLRVLHATPPGAPSAETL